MLASPLRSASAAACLLLAAFVPIASAQEVRVDNGAPTTPAPEYIPGHVIVSFDRGVTAAERADSRDDADTSLGRTLGRSDFQLLNVDPGQSTSGAIAALRADPDVRTVSRDALLAPQAVPNDPRLDELWGLRNLGGAVGVQGIASPVAGADANVFSAWDKTIGSPSTVIGVMDTGYRFEHPDLANRAWNNSDEIAGNGVDDDGNGYVDDTRGYDFVAGNVSSPGRDNDPTDDDLVAGGHGVHTSGTIGAQGNNGIGITGVAQDVRIMPLKVCAYNSATQDERCPESSQIAAVNYAGANGARAVNVSLGGAGASNPTYLDALAHNPQTLFVVSAGNDGTNNDSTPQRPCNYNPATTAVPGAVDNVICVAATTQKDALADFSNYGASSVDVGAPGTEILSSFPTAQPINYDFESPSSASDWTATVANEGFARINEAPLTSFGFTDSPGASPTPNTVRESTSAPVSIPAGATNCRARQTRTLRVGSGTTYTYSFLKDGVVIATSSPTSSGTFGLNLTNIAGSNVQVRLRFSADGTTAAGSDRGAWIDDIAVSCYQGVGAANGYDFLQGTSMAAPHVTGVAALLYSAQPAASVSQVRRALLTTTQAVPALAGKTVTGGRVDAAAAVNALDATKPSSSATAPASTTSPAIPVNYTADATGSTLTSVELWAKPPGASSYTLAATKPGPVPANGTFDYTATDGFGDYAFYAVARDSWGNVEDAPALPDAVASYAPAPPPADPGSGNTGSADSGAATTGAGGPGAGIGAAVGGGSTQLDPIEPAACANKIGPGTATRLTGTALGDLIAGGRKADTIDGGAGDDCIDGGAGNDKLKGGAGKDTVKGGEGNDKLDGGAGDDKLDGGAGNDTLVGGSGINTYSAGAGKDNVSAKNGTAETVNCGAGKDKATVDKNDKVKGCEKVKRK